MTPTRRAFAGGVLAVAAAPCARASERLITGVNLAGLEFKSGRLPGRINHDFVAPGAEELDYYRGLGARAVRLPFLWERVQPRLGGAFDEDHWRVIADLVDATAARGMHIVLDAHGYGRRTTEQGSEIVGESPRVTAGHFASFWAEVARRCPGAHVILGLQNEPHDQDRGVLARVQNAAIAAIRAVGSRQLVLASGSSWSGAHSWVSSGNGEAMLAIRDPLNLTAFDVHQYLDRDSSGTHAECVAGAGSRLEAFTAWARRHRRRGFLGEFGAGQSERCAAELSGLLEHMAANRDVWIGWTAWAGGPWWPDDYPLNLQPASLDGGPQRPQMTVLRRFFE